jgi:ribosomal protein S18 acetylase RimI-like enzyme
MGDRPMPASTPRAERGPGCSPPLAYEPATDNDTNTLLELLRADASPYLELTLRLMGTTWEEFARAASTTGEVRVVRRGSTSLGYIWIELRGRELHIHGIAVHPEMRNQGVGTHVLSDLEQEFRKRADVIELGVHESNVRALRLYERLGFGVETRLPDLGFAILRKPLESA